MSSQGTTLPSLFDVSDPEDERWLLVQRVVSSSIFSRAPQLRGFLLFVASRSLCGRKSEVSEYAIGCAVLGRRRNFNPQEDNIVRVQARHLRAKLEQYFSTDGKDETLVLTIPRGSYLPLFAPNAIEQIEQTVTEADHAFASATAGPTERLLQTVDLEMAPVASSKDAQTRLLKRFYMGQTAHWRRLLFVGILTALAFGAGFMVPRHYTQPEATARSLPAKIGNPLLASVFQTGDSTKIVISDAGAVTLQDALHRHLRLDEYVSRDYPHNIIPAAINGTTAGDLMARTGTGMFANYPDVRTATRLQMLAESYGAKAVLRHPRQLNIRDFESSSFVLIGGPLAIPWYRLFESHMNFVFDVSAETGISRIVNKAPGSGEEAIYTPQTGATVVAYSIVGLMPNLRNSGRVLVLAGTGVEGTEAASNIVVRNDLTADMRTIVNQAKDNTAIEILLQTEVAAGIPHHSKIVAYRIHDEQQY